MSAANQSSASKNSRIAAQEIEKCVVRILIDALTTPARLLEQLGNPDMPSDHLRRLLGRAARFAATLRNSSGQRAKVIRELVERVIIDEERIVVAMRGSALSGGEVPLRASDAGFDGPAGREARCGAIICC